MSVQLKSAVNSAAIGGGGGILEWIESVVAALKADIANVSPAQVQGVLALLNGLSVVDPALAPTIAAIEAGLQTFLTQTAAAKATA